MCTSGNLGGDSSWYLSALRLGMISEGVVKSWCELPFDMEMLGYFERSGFQIHLVFDADVYFLTMVVGVVLPSRHGGFKMSSKQLNDSSSVFG